MLNNLLLRLGFRGHDGKARPGNLDENGNLKVKVSGTNVKEVIKKSLYDLGTEGVTWENGISLGTVEFSKQSDHLFLKVNSPGGEADVSFTTSEKVDFTNIQSIEVDWEATGTSSGHLAGARLVLGTTKDGRYYTNSDTSIIIINTNKFPRQKSKLDTSNLSGDFYIRVHAKSNSSAPRDITLKIYSVKINTVSDESFFSVEKGTNGFTALRTTNAISDELLHGIVKVADGKSRRLPDKKCNGVMIVALDDNVGKVYLGGMNVSNVDYGVSLAVGNHIYLPVNDMSAVHIYADNDGDGISYLGVI